ncbi:GNAT family N-acetyltransferase [Egicoccus sp. AB-alg2]|uniref:GNAT family N-acetyltransferase n=1 Tax=Egicoccus sp. AB-alg2 TaxID=3242693 RepID=UPI00359EBF42
MSADRDLRVELWAGRDRFAEHADELEVLLEAVDAPITARVSWLGTWLRAFPDAQPWVLAARDTRGRLRAAAPLVRQRRRWHSELVLIADGVSDHARLPALDEPAANRLADALTSQLANLRSGWTLALRQLPPDDLVAVRVAARLRRARLLPGRSSPQTHITRREVRAYLSKNHRGQARNRWNRLERDGHHPRVEFLREPARIRAELDEIVAVCRAREREMLGRSPLDEPGRERFLREVTLALAGQGAVELVILRAGGEVAGYTINLLDGNAYRFYNGHHAPRWASYSPGRLIMLELVKRVLDDPALDTIDWMMGQEPYKLSMANGEERALELLAWSSSALGVRVFGAQRLRGRLEVAAGDDERAARLLQALRASRQQARARLAR